MAFVLALVVFAAASTHCAPQCTARTTPANAASRLTTQNFPSQRPDLLPPRPATALLLRGGSAAAPSASLLATTASLVKTIMGIGVLTLAGGMAAGTGAVPATVVQSLITAASAYSFALLGKTCAITGLDEACTFEGLWRATLGARTAWLVDAAIAALTFAISAVYLLCLGSLLPPVLAALRAPPALAARTPAVLLAFAAVYPLCALRSLDRLAFSSYLGVAAILYTAAFSVWRALDGSYASGGALHRPPPPAAAEVGAWTVTPNTLVLVANLGVALCAHFSAPQFYRALAGATPSRFAAMAYAAFGAVLALSLAIMFAGHATFGGAAAPLVLDSYHPTADAGATAARVATVASLGCSFPLIFSALREAALSLGGAGVAPGTAAWWAATLALPPLALAVALASENLGLVVGVLGSLLGGAIIYVAPAAMHLASVRRRRRRPPRRRRPRRVRRRADDGGDGGERAPRDSVIAHSISYYFVSKSSAADFAPPFFAPAAAFLAPAFFALVATGTSAIVAATAAPRGVRLGRRSRPRSVRSSWR